MLDRGSLFHSISCVHQNNQTSNFYCLSTQPTHLLVIFHELINKISLISHFIFILTYTIHMYIRIEDSFHLHVSIHEIWNWSNAPRLRNHRKKWIFENTQKIRDEISPSPASVYVRSSKMSSRWLEYVQFHDEHLRILVHEKKKIGKKSPEMRGGVCPR